METKDNVGLILTSKELEDVSTEVIVGILDEFIKGIGYKKHRGEEEGFSQKDAWYIQINFLKEHFANINEGEAYILLEYMLPGENTERPDVLILLKESVYCLEFKTIGSRIKSEYVTQFIDYRTMLQEYHSVSIKNGLDIKSYLVMCNCDLASVRWEEGLDRKTSINDRNAVIPSDKIKDLSDEISRCNAMKYDEVMEWVESSRMRSKKIWEQGKELKEQLTTTGTNELYSKVKSIPYSDLRMAQDKINDLIKKEEKNIIFVSGVPGAGKTLIGMISLFGSLGDGKNARYYTGNGALKNVLAGMMDSKDISMFTGFRKEHIEKQETCEEDVLIFDEAQRFWDGKKNKLGITDAAGILAAKYKKNITIVCLMGDGQKPMSGEAGIEAWINPLQQDVTWKVYAPKIHEDKFSGINAEYYSELYLDVAKRQHFIDLSGWVEAVLSCDLSKGKSEITYINSKKSGEKFGIKITRSLEKLYGNQAVTLRRLKQIREKQENSEYLFGMFCSSKNNMEELTKLSNRVIWQEWRNKQKDTNTYIPNNEASDWYGGGCCDVENIKVATETFCQGLEVDLPIIFFGGDYLMKKEGKEYKVIINPSKFAKEKYGEEIESIMEDTYRILLTRATEEMILVIPKTSDGKFDDTYQFFKDMGIEEY